MPTTDSLYVNRNYKISFFNIEENEAGVRTTFFLSSVRIQNSVNFSFQYTVTNTTTNMASFRFYNLSDETISLFVSPGGQRGFVLDVWYGDAVDDVTTIFSGIVVQTNTYMLGPDIITEVKGGDLFINLFVESFYKQYKSGTTYDQVLSDVLSFYGNLVGVDAASKAVLASKTFKTNVVIRGQFSTIMARLCADGGLFYTVVGKYLGFVDAATFDQQQSSTYPTISKDTGMIGYPKAVAISQQLYPVFYTTNVVLNKNLSLVQASTLLKPYTLFSTVKLVTREDKLNGLYNVLTVSYAGEWRGNTWYSNLILWPVGQKGSVGVALS